MKSAAFALVLLACSAAHAQRPGSICVAPNSTQAPTRFSPDQYYNPATLRLRIDQQNTISWPHDKPLKISGLALDERHLVALTSDGKPLQALRFRFSEYPGTELCMSFDGYQGVQLYDKGTNRRRAKYCGCTCE
jgi:hypothetical protein